MSCPRGHHLDETVGDEGPEIGISDFVCEACALEDAEKGRVEREVRDAGADSTDYLYGRYWTAFVKDPD
jgi:hypothetical protein